MKLTIQTEQHPEKGYAVVALHGSLDALSAQELEKVLGPLAGDAAFSHVILDMKELGFVASAGLRVLLTAIKDLKAHDGSLSACGVSEPVVKVLKMTGLMNFIYIADTVEKCLSLKRK